MKGTCHLQRRRKRRGYFTPLSQQGEMSSFGLHVWGKLKWQEKGMGVRLWGFEWKKVVMHPGELNPPLFITPMEVVAIPEKQPLSTQLTKERSVFFSCVFFFFLVGFFFVLALYSTRSVASALYTHEFVESCLKCDGAKRCAWQINMQETLDAPPLPESVA